MSNVDIELIKKRLLFKYPFFGSVIANSSFIEKNEISTAATDGENIFYNSKFISNLADDEKVFVFAHEVCHIAFDHIKRRENKNKKIWNTATDAVINSLLKQDGLPLIKRCVNIEEAFNYNAEEMYNKLLKKNNEQKNNSNNSKDIIQGKGNDSNDSLDENVGHDSHDMWGKTIEKAKENDGESPENKKEQHVKKMSEAGEKKVFEKNKKERKKKIEELRKNLANKSHEPGNSTDSATRNIDDIGASKVLINWRRILKETITYNIDWSYRNASIEEGVVVAHLEDIPHPVTEIVLDTSGSVDENLLKNFLRECKNILNVSKIKVGCFDTKFYGFNEIRTDKDIDNMKFVGGGGTDFNVAVNAFTKRVENKIIFTDGCSYMPNKAIDAIWVVFGSKKIKPKGGKVIYIKREELANLSSANKKTR